MRRSTGFLILFMMSTTAFAQSWVDTTLYPFDHQLVQLQNGTMHYVDEGQGDVILFVHGTPTWSLLYREFVKELSANHRCIAVDHLGFGLSQKQDTATSTPLWHAQNLIEFITTLNLQNITLVVHDFGGPIGLAAGMDQHDRIDRVVLFNSWLWATEEDKSVKQIDKLVNSWIGRLLYLNFNFSPRTLLKKGFANKKNLPKALHRQYLHPFPTKASRIPLLDLAKALRGSSAWYQEQHEQLDRLADKQWLILWGTQDQFITMEYLNQWKSRLPKAEVNLLDCGHFVQEEKAAESIVAIRAFLDK